MRQTAKTQKTERRIAVLVDTASTWGRDIIRGIQREARKHPTWSILVEQRGGAEALVLPAEWRADGVIARVSNAGLARQLAATGLPVVNVSAMHVPEAKFARVATDVEAAGRKAAAYYRERGFCHFAYLSLLEQEYVERQRAAFAAAVCAGGQSCAEFSVGHLGGRGQEAARAEALVNWLRALPKPVAVFTWSGGNEVVEACRQAGLAMPEEVALLTGTEDELLCEVSPVPISGVRQPSEQIGGEAAELLGRMMDGKRAPAAPRWLAPLAIVTRQSTDTLAIKDPALVAGLRFIRETVGRPVLVDEVAAAAGVSRRLLERRFAAHLRASPAEYLRRARLERAKVLLTETDRSIPDVAEAAGFGSPEYLAQAFRTELNISPLRYRREARGR
jgi:LacI family transcriptional regulator